MAYTITSGPPRARLTKTYGNVREAGKRYREMVARNATDIVVQHDGQALDPTRLQDLTAR